jgi:hypothetical protein
MRALSLGLVVAWVAVAGLEAGCSSSSASFSGGDGGGQDGPASQGDGSAADSPSPMGDSSTSDTGMTMPDGTMANDGGTEAASSEGGGDSSVNDSGGADTSTPETGSADAGSDASPDASCGSTPSLHVDTGGTIFCGFGDAGDLDCVIGQECCLGGYLGNDVFGPQACSAFGSVCTNGGVPDTGTPAIAMQCAQVADCTANGVTGAASCCLQGANAPADAPGCTYPKAVGGTAVVCETTSACATGEVQICSQQSDCPTGTTCTPGKWKVLQVGFCL